ncbi:MAG: NUDIX domain-containing protein [Planctomycetota bacterium]
MESSPSPRPSGHRDVVLGLCEQGGALLLVRNARTMGGRRGLVWDLPGGAVEPGEALGEALVREWREETGLDARVGDLLFVTDGVRRAEAQGPALATWRVFAFAVASEGDPVPGDDIEAVAWIEHERAPALLDAPYHAPLRRFLAGADPRYARVTWVDAPAGGNAAAEAVRPALDAGALDAGFHHLLVLAAAAATGDPAGVRRAARAALAEDVSPARIEEVLLQVVPYAGFPRAIAAFTAARPILGPHVPAGDDAACASGPETFERVYAGTAPRVRAGLEDLHPDLAHWTGVFAYGRVLARPALTLLERELLAVSILTALGGLDAPLRGHARAAKRLGASRRLLAAAARAGVEGRPSPATRRPADPGGYPAAAPPVRPQPRESPPPGA